MPLIELKHYKDLQNSQHSYKTIKYAKQNNGYSCYFTIKEEAFLLVQGLLSS